VAQSAAGSGPQAREDVGSGFTLNTAFSGSVDSAGHVYDWTTTMGYAFNRHFSADLGVPILFTRGTTSTGTTTSNSGLGDVFGQLQFVAKSPALNFGSVLTAGLPTGDSSKGLSTGRVTFDWTSQVAREFGRWTPFASAGVANSLFDTRYWHRPYTTLGTLAHFEAGAAFDLGRSLTASASAYDVAPWGNQKVYSRILTRTAGGPGGAASHGRVFQNNPVTTGGAEIDRDNGFNADLDFSPLKYVDFDVAYSHSMHFQLDTVSFSVVFNLAPLLRRHGIAGN
jgi:hypothetical protein